MPKDNIESWLNEDEAKYYLETQKQLKDVSSYSGWAKNMKIALAALESLAEEREKNDTKARLMKKHQYQYYYNKEDGSEGNYCIGCGIIEGLDCKSDCAWAKCIEGTRGGE